MRNRTWLFLFLVAALAFSCNENGGDEDLDGSEKATTVEIGSPADFGSTLRLPFLDYGVVELTEADPVRVYQADIDVDSGEVLVKSYAVVESQWVEQSEVFCLPDDLVAAVQEHWQLSQLCEVRYEGSTADGVSICPASSESSHLIGLVLPVGIYQIPEQGSEEGLTVYPNSTPGPCMSETKVVSCDPVDEELIDHLKDLVLTGDELQSCSK